MDIPGQVNGLFLKVLRPIAISAFINTGVACVYEAGVNNANEGIAFKLIKLSDLLSKPNK